MVQFFNEELETQRSSTDAVHQSHNKCAEQVDLLTKTVIQQERQINQLTAKMETMQAQQLSNNLLIWGIDEVNDEDAKETAKDFFKLKMEIESDIAVKRVYRKGKSEPRLLFVQLEDKEDKQAIYKHVKNLKAKKNSKEKGYIVRDDLPEGQQELDRRQRYLMSQNKKKLTGQLNMVVRNNKLLMNNEIYRKPAPPPSAAVILDPGKREIVQTMNLVSTEHQERQNVFYFYASKAANIRDVCAIYKHLKIKHADATHLVVAHNLEGEAPNLKDYADDGEIGAGAKILGVLEHSGNTQTAVYMARYHGQNLGNRRFDLFGEQMIVMLDKLADPGQLECTKLPCSKLRVDIPPQQDNIGIRGIKHSHGASHSNCGKQDGWQTVHYKHGRKTVSPTFAQAVASGAPASHP